MERFLMDDGTPVELSLDYQRERGDMLAYECRELTKERNDAFARWGKASGEAAYYKAKAEYYEKMFLAMVRETTGHDAKAEAARFTREDEHDDGA